MNPYLEAIVCNGPCEENRPRSAGLSLRPSFYSDRGTYERDITAGHLKIIYEGIRSHEALGHFPQGASEAFALMVLRLPGITGTVFMESLLALDACDYVFDESTLSTSTIGIDPDDGTGNREKSAFASVFAIMAGPGRETPEQVLRNSVGIKLDFLRRVGREDLRPRMWKPKPVQTNDGRWFDGEHTTWENPDAPPSVDPSCGYTCR